MPPKRRGRKGATAKKTRAKKNDPFAEERRSKLDSILGDLNAQVEKRCKDMVKEMATTCNQIHVIYDMALLSIPAECHDLTLQQYREKMKSKNAELNKAVDEGISKLFDISSMVSRYERYVATTAKKKNNMKKFTSASKVQKKYQKDVVNTSIATARTTRRALAQTQAVATPVSKGHGLPVNFTPQTKKSAPILHTPAITPKFDPSKPLVLNAVRKPKIGEILMSMSGSPVQIPTVSNPGLTFSLDGGQVLNLADPSSFSRLNSNLDQSTRQTLKRINEKLNKVLAL